VLGEVTLRRPLVAQPGERLTLQLVLRRDGATAGAFEIASRAAGAAGAWRVHAAASNRTPTTPMSRNIFFIQRA